MSKESEGTILEAMTAAVQGDIGRARVLLKRVVTKEPDNVHALISLGTLLNTTDDGVRDAAKYLIRAVTIDSNNASAWGQLGESLLRMKEYDRAERYIRRAIALEPGDANYWHRLGLLLDMTERTDEAIEAVEKSLELNASEEITWITLGSIYLKLEQAEDAEQAFIKAVSLNPNNPIARDRLSQALELKQKQTS